MDYTTEILSLISSLGYIPDTESVFEHLNGYNSRVFSVKTDRKDLIIKIVKNDTTSVEKDIAVRKYVLQHLPDMPIPKTLHVDFSEQNVPFKFIILEKMKGATLKETLSTIPKKEDVFYQIGELKGKMNSLKNSVFAEIGPNLIQKNQSSSWLSFIEQKFQKIYAKLQQFSLLSSEELNSIKTFWKKNNHLVEDDVGPCFCHGDTSFSNILISDTQNISGIIDFEYAMWGCGLYDLFSSVRSKETVTFASSVLKGYAKYCVVPSSWKKLMNLYQWLAHLNRLSGIKSMKWRDLSPEESEARRTSIFNGSLSRIHELMH